MLIFLTPTQPAWVQPVAEAIVDSLIGVLILGLVLTILPIWAKPWLVELAAWLTVAGGVPLILLLIGLVIQLNGVGGTLLMLAFLIYLGYWVPRTHRAVDFDVEGVIAAPAERVFALVTDLSAKSRLHPGMVSAVTVDGEALKAGSRIKARFRPTKLEADSLVLEFDPPRRYAERLLSGAPEVVVTIEVTARADRTVLHFRSHQVLSYPGAVLIGYMKRARTGRLRKLRTDWLERVRRELEAPA